MGTLYDAANLEWEHWTVNWDIVHNIETGMGTEPTGLHRREWERNQQDFTHQLPYHCGGM